MKRFPALIASVSDPTGLTADLKKFLTCMVFAIMAFAANAADYYLIGEFNNWTLADDGCKFTASTDGTYTLDFQGTLYSEFKINDGTWSNPDIDYGGYSSKLIPGQLFTLYLGGYNITMDVELVNPHLVLDPKNQTLLVTGEESPLQKGIPQTMVTLSHDGDLSFYTNLTAFESALQAAQNGDIIYLTEGDFYITEGKLTLDKRISIVGSGHNSHLSGDILIDMSSNPDSFMDAPLFDGVRLDKISFGKTDAAVENMSKSEIRHCRINELVDVGYAGKEVLLAGCFLDGVDFNKPANIATTVEMRNSKVLKALRFQNCNMVLNCNVTNVDYYPETMISSVFKNYRCAIFGSKTPVIWNTLLSSDTSNVQTKDCNIQYDFYMDDNCNPELYMDLSYYLLGLDGTEVGAYGGSSPYSTYPSVPTVNSNRSRVEYDSETNKLKVTIRVADN